jgi:hypothetical protein
MPETIRQETKEAICDLALKLLTIDIGTIIEVPLKDGTLRFQRLENG